jgi:hypothetical protein
MQRIVRCDALVDVPDAPPVTMNVFPSIFMVLLPLACASATGCAAMRFACVEATNLHYVLLLSYYSNLQDTPKRTG